MILIYSFESKMTEHSRAFEWQNNMEKNVEIKKNNNKHDVVIGVVAVCVVYGYGQ